MYDLTEEDWKLNQSQRYVQEVVDAFGKNSDEIKSC